MPNTCEENKITIIHSQIIDISKVIFSAEERLFQYRIIHEGHFGVPAKTWINETNDLFSDWGMLMDVVDQLEQQGFKFILQPTGCEITCSSTDRSIEVIGNDRLTTTRYAVFELYCQRDGKIYGFDLPQ